LSKDNSEEGDAALDVEGESERIGVWVCDTDERGDGDKEGDELAESLDLGEKEG